jgi:hypothetical protein
MTSVNPLVPESDHEAFDPLLLEVRSSVALPPERVTMAFVFEPLVVWAVDSVSVFRGVGGRPPRTVDKGITSVRRDLVQVARNARTCEQTQAWLRITIPDARIPVRLVYCA